MENMNNGSAKSDAYEAARAMATEFTEAPGNDRESVTTDIIDLEWKMFSTVPNVGGPADCQSEDETFKIMRRSQFHTWSDATLRSYRDDLKYAVREGRNLMTEKYARMMSVTHPEEYAKIAPALPPLPDTMLQLVQRIADQHAAWDDAVAQKYPNLRGKGRIREEAAQAGGSPTAQTYLIGELLTYSPATVQCVFADVENAVSAGRNLVEEQLEATVKQYGWSDLATAETHQ